MKKCEKCADFYWTDSCTCEPFTIIDEDGEEYTFYAKNKEDAAEKFAEQTNVDGDYYLLNDSAEITVNGDRYRISAEPSIHYYVDRIVEPAEQED